MLWLIELELPIILSEEDYKAATDFCVIKEYLFPIGLGYIKNT